MWVAEIVRECSKQLGSKESKITFEKAAQETDNRSLGNMLKRFQKNILTYYLRVKIGYMYDEQA